MATIKIKTDDGVQEYDSSALVLGENEMLIDKTNPPKGIFNQNGVNSLVKKQVNGTQEKVLDKMLNSDEYSDFERKLIQRKYNVTLDEDGNPQELKPNFDKEQWKSNEIQKATEPLKNQVSDLESKLNSRNEKLLEKSIASSIGKHWKNEYMEENDGVVMSVEAYKKKFDFDKNGNPALKGSDGFALDGNGNHIDPDDYFSDKNRFENRLADTTQAGSGFQNGTNGTSGKNFTDEQVANMSHEEIKKNKQAILKSMNS